MECERPNEGRQRRCSRLSLLLCALLVVATVVIILLLVLCHGKDAPPMRGIFLERCGKFKGYDCPKVWEVFQKAYVCRNPWTVHMDDYDALMAVAPTSPACDRMMFWSGTEELVHKLTKHTDCYVTLEDSMLGAALNGLTWCSKEGSSETFITGCPGWTDCNNSPVRSFWKRASAAFAEVACGNVYVMLNGSFATPFNPTSIFATIEVMRFNSTRVKSLNVVLATQPNSGVNCTNASLKDLQKELDPGIKYNCKEVPVSKIEECGSDPEKPCGSCW